MVARSRESLDAVNRAALESRTGSSPWFYRFVTFFLLILPPVLSIGQLHVQLRHLPAMPRRFREPEPCYDENEIPSSQSPDTESITFTSFTISPRKRPRTHAPRHRVTRHEVPIAPTFAEARPPTPSGEDTSSADVDMNAGEDGTAGSNAVYIEEDDVPTSRRDHVSTLFLGYIF